MTTTDPASAAPRPDQKAAQALAYTFNLTAPEQERAGHMAYVAYEPLLRQVAAALAASGAVLSRIRGSSSALAVELEVEAALAAVRAALGE